MDALSRELQTFLVRMGTDKGGIPEQAEHYIEHLLHLLDTADEDAMVHYYGLFGAEQMALGEIARANGIPDEDMIARIDACLRRLAVTPEWQMIKHECAGQDKKQTL